MTLKKQEYYQDRQCKNYQLDHVNYYYYYYSSNKDASDSRLDIYLTKSEFN